jgi:hypothetical protein
VKNVELLKNMLKDKNSNNLQKEDLLNLINLFDSFNEKSFLENLIFNLDDLTNNLNEVNKTKLLIINLRVNSVLLSMNKKKYLNKHLIENRIVYEYENFFLIFIENWDLKILDVINYLKNNFQKNEIS